MQFLVVMGLVRGRFIPLMFILMTSRKKEDYTRAIEALPLSDLVRTIIVDFERANIKALNECIQDMQLNIRVRLYFFF